MMRVETPLSIFGYPVLAISFFLVAGLCGFYLVFTILFTDVSDPKR